MVKKYRRTENLFLIFKSVKNNTILYAMTKIQQIKNTKKLNKTFLIIFTGLRLSNDNIEVFYCN